MTIKTIGALAISEINAEFGLGKSLSSYAGVRWYTDANGTGTFPTGSISMSSFQGKRKSSPATRKTYDNSWSTSGTFTVPANFVSLNSMVVYIWGGGGQGAGWPSGAEGGGGGEGASLEVSSTAISLTPGQQFSITVGAGGTSGYTNGQSGNPGGDSTFGAGTILATTARGGVGGSASRGATSRNLAAQAGTSSGGIVRGYYLGGATSGRGGVANNSDYGGGGGASNCYDGNGDGIYDEGGTTGIYLVFAANNAGRGGAGCGGGDQRINAQGYYPAGGGGGADYNATGGNGAGGAIRVYLDYMGT